MTKAIDLLKTSVVLLFVGVALTACERRAADDTTSQSSGAQSARLESAGSSSRSDSGSEASSTLQRAERAVDDSVLTTKAKSALLADTTVKGSEVNVETNKGVVTLSGAVENERQRERVASIVRGIDGVKSVENKMTLKK
ncbi:hyperosmotically inducible protein [Paucimonas lemoignei]|uniref:Osmotically-inducible protein Y n=1 Tax=Paucimonas lemoignei TaxID=29443 RepID=A0A4R3HS91_PAULE|nr:BON domain-containing protein [Paucimonas lemoignei]TCS34694.1 hyperosmotically inducible protein [Paucimonas lemoignei]